MIEALRKTGNIIGKVAGRGGLGRLLDYLRKYKAYLTRITTAGGEGQDDTVTKQLYRILQSNNLYDNTLLLVTAEGGLKVRQSGIEQFVEVAYDLGSVPNDASQTTESSQPFVGGRIAPNEKQCFRSVTGATKTFTHPGIVVSGTYTIVKVLDAESIGKNAVSFQEVTTGTINSISWTGDLYFQMIYAGTISQAIRDNMSATLLGIFPAIQTVQIGTQHWATSNFRAVATPQGNVIANVTANATWADSQNIYDTTYAQTSGTDEEKTYAAVKAAAMWCFYNNDPVLGAIYGKIRNGFADILMQMDIDYYNAANPTTHWGYHIPTQAEQDTLTDYLGDDAGDDLKHDGTTYWTDGTGTNSSGYTALPAGYRDTDGIFRGINEISLIGSVDDTIDNRIGRSTRLIKD